MQQVLNTACVQYYSQNIEMPTKCYVNALLKMFNRSSVGFIKFKRRKSSEKFNT